MNDTHAIAVFVNPVAGKGKCRKKYTLAARTLQQAGFECDVVVSQYPGHITNASSELAARGQQTVVVCGGDGTINEVVNGIAGTDTALGIVPLGICNNFATAMGIHKDIPRACKIIVEGHQKRADLIRVNEDKLISGAGMIALEAEAAAFAVAKRKDKSSLNVFKRIGNLLKVFSFQPKTVGLRFDGKRIFGEVLAVTFENIHPSDGELSAGDPPQENHPSRDGWLEVCIFGSVPKWRLLSRLAMAGKKERLESKGVTYHRTRAVHVQSLGHLGFYSDGDFVTSTPFRLQAMPEHLNVLVPRMTSN